MSGETSTTVKHRVRWFVWGWDPDTNVRAKIPRTSGMRGLWGYDASCSCGWETRTGGATRRSVERYVQRHKWLEGVDDK